MSGATWTLWLPAAVSLVGAGLAYLGAWNGTRQRDTAGRREEWGRRFTAALEWTARDSERARVLGRTLLGALARSELASAEEQRLADFLLEREARYSDQKALIGEFESESLDEMRFIEDTGGSNVAGTTDIGGGS